MATVLDAIILILQMQKKAFSKLRFNFKHFDKKDEPHSWSIFELRDSERRG